MNAPLRPLLALLAAVLCLLAGAQTAAAVPTADFTITPDATPEPGVTVTFTAVVNQPLAGEAYTFLWTFPSGPTESGPTASRTYDRPGIRTVKLDVTGSLGTRLTVERQVRVNRPPVARFRWNPGTPLIGQPVVFDASRSRDDSRIVEYEWDLDGNPRNGSQGFEVNRGANKTVTASFPASGARRIRLRVTDEDEKQDTRAWIITVNAAPKASFMVSPPNPVAGDTITLSSTSADPDGPLASQKWDLDNDGQYDDAAGAVVQTKLPKGSHVVRLRVADTPGAIAVAERRIRVRRAPVRLLEGVRVLLFGELTRTGARLRGLVVRTPAGATVKVRCKGDRSCPRGSTKKRPSTIKRLRFKKFERSFRAGAVITVTVTRAGYIGRYTSIKIRSRLRRYIRRDRCVKPATNRPVRCSIS